MKPEKTFEAGIGWAFSQACALLDKGEDPRKYDIANLLPEANKDFADCQKYGREKTSPLCLCAN